MHLGYPFRWYLRGPYSPRLTEDVFALPNLHDKGAAELRQWKLDGPSRARMTKFKGLMQTLPTNKLAKWLELLSSVLFLIRTGQAQATDTAGITSILHHNNKKHLSEPEVQAGLAMLKRHGFAV